MRYKKVPVKVKTKASRKIKTLTSAVFFSKNDSPRFCLGAAIN